MIRSHSGACTLQVGTHPLHCSRLLLTISMSRSSLNRYLCCPEIAMISSAGLLTCAIPDFRFPSPPQKAINIATKFIWAKQSRKEWRHSLSSQHPGSRSRTIKSKGHLRKHRVPGYPWLQSETLSQNSIRQKMQSYGSHCNSISGRPNKRNKSSRSA